MNYLRLIFLSIVFLCNNICAQNPPSDFKLSGTTGGLAPWTRSETITILADGQVDFFRFKGGELQ